MPRQKQNRDVEQARQHRSDMSLPERLLWTLLRKSPDGVKFRRQHPLGSYTLDFYCAAAKVCVEIDGIAHDMGDRPQHDAQRDAWLRHAGLEVLRIPAADVLKAPEDEAEALVRFCKR